MGSAKRDRASARARRLSLVIELQPVPRRTGQESRQSMPVKARGAISPLSAPAVRPCTRNLRTRIEKNSIGAHEPGAWQRGAGTAPDRRGDPRGRWLPPS
jgi:hypothetical protein